MKAAEARKQAEKNLPIIAKRQRDFEAKQAAEKKAKERTKRRVWREGFEARVRKSIASAVEQGKTESTTSIVWIGDMLPLLLISTTLTPFSNTLKT